jgi:hypothetical protein
MHPQVSALIKKKTKFYSYVRKFRWYRVKKSHMRKGFLIYEEMRKFFPIYMRRPVVIYDFAPDFLIEKSYFLFNQCMTVPVI